jgi:release factor glutamine methyltransferase
VGSDRTVPESTTVAAAEPWTIGRVLVWTTKHFAEHGIDSPRLDAELLLAAALGKNRLYLYTHYDQPLMDAERAQYRLYVQRRAKREPVAYILGEREFYGLAFTVTRDVLIPRPETEHLVDAVREWFDANPCEHPQIADVGTGSGAIAVALAVQVPAAALVATDISAQALLVAQQNAARHAVSERIHFVESDLLTAVVHDGLFHVIAANLPYIAEPERAELMPEVRDHEPTTALFAGVDGLALIRRLIAEAPARLASPGLLALEMGAGQWPAVQQALLDSAVFSAVRAVCDLQGHKRVALASRGGS